MLKTGFSSLSIFFFFFFYFKDFLNFIYRFQMLSPHPPSLPDNSEFKQPREKKRTFSFKHIYVTNHAIRDFMGITKSIDLVSLRSPHTLITVETFRYWQTFCILALSSIYSRCTKGNNSHYFRFH